MNLKYYLRGLGLGIIVTALIMGIAGSKKTAMSDAEIRARAEAMGMTDNSDVLTENTADSSKIKKGPKTDTTEQTAATVKNSTAVKASASTSKTSLPNTSSNTSSSKTSSPKTSSAVVETSSQTSETAASKTVTETSKAADTGNKISIVSGDSSYSVAKKLKDVGLISSASAYDSYLCSNGYDKKIRTGTYSIPSGASQQQIAEKIIGR